MNISIDLREFIPIGASQSRFWLSQGILDLRLTLDNADIGLVSSFN